jgi:RsiW-degrading membrane proteinase PrsW (M82 family)
MGAVALFVIAVAPGLFIMWYIHHKDKYEPEPKGLIIATFFIGVGAAVPASLVEILFEWGLGIPTEGNIPAAFINAFLVVAPAEEIAKYLSVRVKAYRSPAFNEVMDGIVYSVAAALGFATIENILYVYQLGFAVGILRAVCSVPMHALCGAIIGYYLGMNKMNAGSKRHFILAGLAIAIVFHGAYDFVLFTGTFLGFLIIPIMFWLYRIYRRRLLLALAGSPFRGARDEGLFLALAKHRTPAGIIKTAVGVVLLTFSAVMTTGAVVSVSSGNLFSARQYGYIAFLVIVPLIIGIILFILARKDVVT